MHHRPPRERTSPFGHYLRCTPFTVPCTPINWITVTTPCLFCLITPTILTILYLSSAIYIYSLILRYPPTPSPLLYLYFYLFLYFILLFILIFLFFILYFYKDKYLYFYLFSFIFLWLSITYFISIEFIYSHP